MLCQFTWKVTQTLCILFSLCTVATFVQNEPVVKKDISNNFPNRTFTSNLHSHEMLNSEQLLSIFWFTNHKIALGIFLEARY